MTAQPQYVYFNGGIVPFADAKVGILTHALHYSTSCFEGIRGNWNDADQTLYVFRMEEHYRRLQKSAAMLMIDLGHTPSQLCDITVELLQKCGYQQDVYIRPMAYKSSERVVNLILTTLDDGLSIAAFPVGNYLEASRPIHCTTSAWNKPPDTAVPSGTKVAGIYTTNILAKTDAVSKGFDEAILLTPSGLVSEGSGENIFLVIDGRLHTPPGSDNCLMGITRNSVMRIAQEAFGIEVCERSIGRSEIYTADEVFLSGTAAHITPVGELDKRPIADGRVGPITKRLQDAYFQVIRGADEKYKEWCTPVKV